MEPQAIIAALPILKKVWKVLPPNLRVPVLLVAAGVGVWQYLAGKKAGEQKVLGDEAAPSSTSTGAGR